MGFRAHKQLFSDRPCFNSAQKATIFASVTTFLTKILNCDYHEYSWDTLLLPLKYKCRKRRALGKLGKLAALLSAMYYYVQYSTAEPTNIPEYTCCLIPQSPRAFLQSFQFGRCFCRLSSNFLDGFDVSNHINTMRVVCWLVCN